jgi:hypothetical protein
MGRIASLLDLPLDQKFYIAALYLSVEYLSQLAVEQGKPDELLRKENLKYVEQHLGPSLTEANIDSFIRKIIDFHNSQS